MIRAQAFAKINLSLEVGAAAGPLHTVRGLFQSIQWSDHLSLAKAGSDSISRSDGEPVIDGWRNLAWRAVAAVREAAATASPLSLTLDKEIPVAAGLGGGSADAAAALALAGRLLDVAPGVGSGLAADLGADVPFCLRGGLARVSGTGERVEPLPATTEYAIGLVVPPVEVATAAVYAAWDRLGRPAGPEIAPNAVPPPLRAHTPLRNDLYPAAVAVAGEIDEWRAELANRWGRPVVLTGSGPTLFSFFVDVAEAAAALDVVPAGARATQATLPVDAGWRFELAEEDAGP